MVLIFFLIINILSTEIILDKNEQPLCLFCASLDETFRSSNMDSRFIPSIHSLCYFEKLNKLDIISDSENIEFIKNSRLRFRKQRILSLLRTNIELADALDKLEVDKIKKILFTYNKDNSSMLYFDSKYKISDTYIPLSFVSPISRVVTERPKKVGVSGLDINYLSQYSILKAFFDYQKATGYKQNIFENLGSYCSLDLNSYKRFFYIFNRQRFSELRKIFLSEENVKLADQKPYINMGYKSSVLGESPISHSNPYLVKYLVEMGY